MTEDERKILEDMKGFIDFGIKHDKPFGWILSNLGHDITGLLSKTAGFCPRTSGHSKNE